MAKMNTMVRGTIRISHVFFGQRENGLFFKHLNERGAQVGDERAVQVALGRNRNGGGFLSALKPQFPLVPPLMQVADVWRNRCAPERLPDSLIRRGLDPIRCHGEVRVGPQVGGNFRSLGLVNADYARSQSWIQSLESVTN